MTKDNYLAQIDAGGFKLPALSGFTDADGAPLEPSGGAATNSSPFGGAFGAAPPPPVPSQQPLQPPGPHQAQYAAPPPPDTFSTGRAQQVAALRAACGWGGV